MYPMLGIILLVIASLVCESQSHIRRAAANESFLAPAKYHNYNELKTLFDKLERNFPKLTKVHSVGKSVRNRDLLVIELNSNVNDVAPLTPKFKYVANMHGDETIGRQLMIYLAQYLLYNYGTDPRVTQLMNKTDIFLMPSMNPDGFESSQEGKCDSLRGYRGRQNEEGVDLNRNFPDQFVKTKQHIQPETEAMMTWIVSNQFVLSGNMHGGAVVASYPYDNSKSGALCCEDSPTPDDDLFRRLALLYASNHPKMKTGEACPDEELSRFNHGITNGANWYQLSGGMQDFNYVRSNCFEVTFELSCCKFPAASTLEEEWQRNKESLLSFMEATQWGVKGTVTDEEGQPVADVQIVIESIDHHVVTTSKGEYWRLLLPGRYEMYAKAYGYEQTDPTSILIAEDRTTLKNMVLKRVAKGAVEDHVVHKTAVVNDTGRNSLGDLTLLCLFLRVCYFIYTFVI